MNYLDTECFLFLNKILLDNIFTQYFFGILSHKNESWINVMVMLLLNILAILIIPKNNRSKAICIVLYCWLSFQVFLLVNNFIFHKILDIHRNSPSIMMLGSIKLSSILNNSNIKDYSNNCFPSGHALVVTYWLLFLKLYATRKIIIIGVLTSILFVMPRMITGAHWLSDILVAVMLGWLYFNLSIWTANKYDSIKYRLY